MNGFSSSYGGSTSNKKKNTWDVGELAAFESLTPNQQAVSGDLVKALQALLAGGTGGQSDFNATQAMQQFSPYTGPVGSALQSALISSLSGEVPSQAFETGIAGPTRRTFQEETAPAIREEFAGPGTYWGTARANKVSDEGRRVEQNLVEQRARMVEGSLNRALQATQPALAAQTSALQMAFEDYIRRNPAAAEGLQAALSYLGIPMMATYQPY